MTFIYQQIGGPIPFSQGLKAKIATIHYTDANLVKSNINSVANDINSELDYNRSLYKNVPHSYALVPDLDSESFIWIKEGVM